MKHALGLVVLVCLVGVTEGFQAKKAWGTKSTLTTPAVLTSVLGNITSSSVPVLSSRNDLWKLSFTNGCIKILDSNGLFVWAPPNNANCVYPGATLSLTQTNQLVVYNAGTLIWSSGVGGGVSNGYLRFNDNRNLQIFDREETLIWESGTDFSDCMVSSEKWVSGQAIPRGSVIRSPNLQYSLTFEANGRFVLYDDNFPIWGTNPSIDARITFDATTRVLTWAAQLTQPFEIAPTSQVFAQTCLMVRDDRSVIMHKGYGGESGIVYTAPTRVRMLKRLKIISAMSPPAGAILELNGQSNALNYNWPGTGYYFHYLVPEWTDNIQESVSQISCTLTSDSNYVPPADTIIVPHSYSLPYVGLTRSVIKFPAQVTFDATVNILGQSYSISVAPLPPITAIGLWRTTNTTGIDQIPFGHSERLAFFIVGSHLLYIVYTNLECLPDGTTCSSGTCSNCCNPATWHPIKNSPTCGYVKCERQGTLCGLYPPAPVTCDQCCRVPLGGPITGAPVSICG